jgi:uncharacterized protein YlxW (UPF0749 family)
MSRLPHVRLPRSGRSRHGGAEPDAGATAHREGGSRSTVWRVATPVVGLLSGTLFVVSAHSSNGTDLRPGRYTDLASFVRVDAAQYDALKQRVADLNAQITLLNSQSDNKQVRKVTQQIALMKVRAGLMPVTGPGLTVTLSDAPHTTPADGADSPDNRLLVVHQQDIQAVVNALWKGGAQAVTIQGQRVVGTTGIRCIGNAVQLQGVPYSQPYVIAAVGDPTTMASSIARDSYLEVYREDAADPTINVGWDERVETRLELPGYDGLLGLTYAQVLSPGTAGS